jgi:hypothetical protein
MSPSSVAAPGRVMIGRPVPDAEARKAMYSVSSDQVEETPRVSKV